MAWNIGIRPNSDEFNFRCPFFTIHILFELSFYLWLLGWNNKKENT